MKELLRQEIQCAGELLALFVTEKHALANLDNEQIMAHTHKKEVLIDKLQAATLSRIALMDDSSGHEGREEPAFREDPEIRSLLATLDKLAAGCLAENRNIGHLIHRRSQLIGSMIGSLRGLNAQEVTYSADGMRHPATGSQNHATI